MTSYENWMRICLSLAKTAASFDEVPVGALIVKDNKIIAAAYNQREYRHDPCAHAELMAIRKAARLLGGWRLTQCDLYVTLEPCVMCSGAISQSRLERVIYGAADPKAGALGSLYSIHEDARLNHRLTVIKDVLATESSMLLKDFFRMKRSS